MNHFRFTAPTAAYLGREITPADLGWQVKQTGVTIV